MCPLLLTPAFAQTNFAILGTDGAWTWYNDPRALFHNGKLYFGYVRAGDSKTALSVFDLTTGTKTDLWSGVFTQLDDHNNPALLVKQDKTMLAVYSRHLSDQFFAYRLSSSTNPVTAVDWGGELRIPASGASMTYANPFQLSAESGKIFNFCRNQNFNPTVYTSTDGGSNWSAPQLFIQTGTGGNVRPYVKYSSDYTNRIDFLYTDGHPRDCSNSLYHIYYQGDAFYRTDGTLLKNYASLPILHDSGERGSVIYQWTNAPQSDPNQWIQDGRAWCWETASQTNGAPVCVFTVQRDLVTGPTQGTDDRIYYYYARWTGTSWQKRFIAQAGRPIYAAENDYAGGICVDPKDPNVIYISSNAGDPFNLADTTNVPLRASERYELWRGVTTNGGLNFTWTQITTNSTVDNFRPYVPRRNGGEQCVLWFRGTYAAYTSYSCSMVGLFTTAVPAPPAPKITYVDATSGASGNTAVAAGGTFAPPSNSATATDWNERSPLASGGNIFESSGATASLGENAPRLVTAITNLSPGGTYALYAYFWSKTASSTTEQWLLRAGLTNGGGELTLFGTSGSGNMGITSTAASLVSTTTNFLAAPTIISESGRLMYQASLGQAIADGTGKIPVFIDDYSPATTVNNRTWYDGVGYATLFQTATNPPTLGYGVSSNTLSLSWPASHIGWRLQVQTNLLNVGLRTNWVEIPGAATTNQMTMSLSPANGSIFYRLTYTY